MGYSFCLYRYRALIAVYKVINSVSQQPYDSDGHNCLDYSREAQVLLREKGIESVVVIGDIGKDYKHAVIGVLISPQSGRFIEGFVPEYIK